MDKKIALQNLILLDEIFRRNNTEYWLSCGTLLGFYRQGDFISHDLDTDVCISIDSLNLNLLKDIFKNGFKCNRVFGRIHDGFEIALFKNGVKTDLFFVYKKDDYWYHSVYANFTNIDSVKYDYIFEPIEIKETQFLGHMFKTPSDIESVLKQQYGEDWAIPNKNWCYYRSPKNARNTNKRVLISDTLDDFKRFTNGM